MKISLSDTLNQFITSAVLVTFLLCAQSSDNKDHAARSVEFSHERAVLQDTLSKGENLVLNVVPAARKVTDRLLETADLSVKKLRAHDIKETQRANAADKRAAEAERMVNEMLQSMNEPAVTFSTNDYEGAEPCPTDTVKLYYKKTLFGKIKPINKP